MMRLQSAEFCKEGAMVDCDEEDAELREVEDSGHVTRREFRSGMMIVHAVNFAVLLLLGLILLRLVTK